MSSNASVAPYGVARKSRKISRSTNGGDLPPGDDEMEARVTALENTTTEIKEKLTRLETRFESVEKNMATKTDIAELKMAMAEGFTNQTKWFFSTATAVAVIAFTAAKFIH